MTYSGTYKIKHKSKYKGDVSKVVYRSMWEKYVFMWLDSNPDVKYWSSEETVIPYYYEYDKRYHKYFVDIKVTYKDGNTSIIEIKPEYQTKPPTGRRKTKKYIREGLEYVKNMNKWQAASEYAKDRNWKFEIWTERQLTAKGILKKRIKPLKKL